MSDGGKGDRRRPEDVQAFSEGYDRIFGNAKPQRGKFIWSEAKHRFVPAEEFRDEAPEAHFVMGDIQPYRSTVTGEEIASRSAHRAHLRQHKLVEIGNETHYLKPKPRTVPAGRKDLMIALADNILRNR